MERNSSAQKRNILITASAIVVLLLAGIVFSGIVPLVNMLKQRRIDLDNNRLELEALQQDVAKLEKYDNLKKELNQNKDLIDRALLKEETLVSFIEEFERIASESQCQIMIEQYQPPKKKKTAATDEPKIDSVEKEDNQNYLLISLEGNYVGLLNFIYKIENSGYAFELKSVDSKTKNNSAVLINQLSEENKAAGNIESKLLISFSLRK